MRLSIWITWAILFSLLSSDAHSQRRRTRGRAGESGLQILNPREQKTTTTRESVNILGRTDKGTTASVGGIEAPVLTTGLFVRDHVPLNPGPNFISVSVDGVGSRTLTVERLPIPTPAPLPAKLPLFIDESSIRPRENLILAHSDLLEVEFTGAPENEAAFRSDWSDWVAMEEAIDANGDGTGQYRGAIAAFSRTDYSSETSSPVAVRLTTKLPDGRTTAVLAQTSGTVALMSPGAVHLAEVIEPNAPVAFGLHDVRLGGPNLAELSTGTIVRLAGKSGAKWKLALAPAIEGWIDEENVRLVGPSRGVPHLSFTSISVGGDDEHDLVTIPYSARVPFAVESGTAARGNALLSVDFFGAHHAATWISHKPTAKVVKEARVRQVGKDHVRVELELKQKQLWGYRYEVTTGSLRIIVRRPPVIAPEPASPLQGLTIALEPGHGGSNHGARGQSGSLEKDINRMTVDALATELRALGSTVVIVRKGDEEVSLTERVRRSVEADADLFISVHANSGGSDRGYLAVGGTSTYYKTSFSRPLSEAIQKHLLEETGLPDFGHVGNFNYTPIRLNTWMPAMLVEQAFMSNPAEEAKMLDPAFREKTARAVRLGMEDFLRAGNGLAAED